MLNMLLHLFAIALIGCSLFAAFTYIYSVTTNRISVYRSHLNMGAYKAQFFLDQREALLRSIAATAIHTNSLPPLRATTNGPQLTRLPLPHLGKATSWELLLTQRYFKAIKRSGKRLIYSPPSPLPAFALEQKADNSYQWTPLEQGSISGPRTINGFPSRSPPVIWLRQPDGDGERLIVYAPVDRTDDSYGWIGLELQDLHHTLQLEEPPETSYALLDSHGSIVLHSQGAPKQINTLPGDHFGFESKGWIPQDIVLSKTIGTGGLRIVYSIPMCQLWKDIMGTLYQAAIAELLFILCVLLGMRTIQRQLIMPAQRQHEALIDSVTLNQKLIAIAPIGLALIVNDSETVLRENEQAHLWRLHDPFWRNRLAKSNDTTVHSDALLDNGSIVHITSVPLSYRGLSVSLCVASDITAQKEIEASLNKARKFAEDTSQAKTRFLATMSHEIRTPLYGITGTLELLNLTEMTMQQKHYLDTLHRSATALFGTVNDTLDLSRIEAGHVKLNSAPFYLLELADEVISAFAARAESKGLCIYSVVDPQLTATVIGDPEHIRQILDNLVSNAIKFTDAGHVVLRVKLLKTQGAKVHIIFQVSDTGIGIAEEFIPRIFDPYFRPDTSPVRQAPGTGLGLAICHQLSRLMQGSLHVVSKPGLGTSISFELSLPVTHEQPPQVYPELYPRPIYVSGLLPETVSNLCAWLRHWGGLAVPYNGHKDILHPEGIMVQAWPPVNDQAHWQGPHILASPKTGQHELNHKTNVYFAPAHSVLGMGVTIQKVQRGHSLGAAPSVPIRTQPQLGLRLLVVDDNPINHLILKEQLQTLGCDVACFHDGRQVLKNANLHTFDAVLTDLNMPLLSGYELAQGLRKLGYSGSILGMTADAFPDTEKKWHHAGMDCLLIKPLSLSMLQEQLKPIACKET